jgi:hypothetical protein
MRRETTKCRANRRQGERMKNADAIDPRQHNDTIHFERGACRLLGFLAAELLYSESKPQFLLDKSSRRHASSHVRNQHFIP